MAHTNKKTDFSLNPEFRIPDFTGMLLRFLFIFEKINWNRCRRLYFAC